MLGEPFFGAPRGQLVIEQAVKSSVACTNPNCTVAVCSHAGHSPQPGQIRERQSPASINSGYKQTVLCRAPKHTICILTNRLYRSQRRAAFDTFQLDATWRNPVQAATGCP